MPGWMIAIIGCAAVLTASGVIWQKALRPGAMLISTIDEALPVLRSLVAEFSDTPESLRVLREVAAQFRTDSGSSLRDVVNRIEQTADALALKEGDSRSTAQVIGVNLEAERQLAIEDRRQLALLVTKVEKLLASAEADKTELHAHTEQTVEPGGE